MPKEERAPAQSSPPERFCGLRPGTLLENLRLPAPRTRRSSGRDSPPPSSGRARRSRSVLQASEESRSAIRVGSASTQEFACCLAAHLGPVNVASPVMFPPGRRVGSRSVPAPADRVLAAMTIGTSCRCLPCASTNRLGGDGNDQVDIEPIRAPPQGGKRLLWSAVSPTDTRCRCVLSLDVAELAEPAPQCHAHTGVPRAEAPVTSTPIRAVFTACCAPSGKRHSEGTSQRGQQEAAAVHPGMVGRFNR